MANPVIVVCAADTWIKVATDVTSGVIWAYDNPGHLIQTYRPTGDAAPVSDSEGVNLILPGEEISSLSGIDVYVMSKNKTGSVRVDL
jgi:hypothetical protein